MGRRKIEIQPIREERNRTVTFIKRKAGLFKKAHELAVLCQVDVAVLILGSNNTFYEFSSVDMRDMIKYYQRNDLAHDVKEPSDFGAYKKKEHIKLNQHTGKKVRKNYYSGTKLTHERADMEEDLDEDDEDPEENQEDGDEDGAHNFTYESNGAKLGTPGRITRSTLKREQPGSFNTSEESNLKPEMKKPKLETSPPKFNPLQQMVQRQFQNLYHAASNSTASPPSNPSTDLPRVSQSGPSVRNPSPPVSSVSPDNTSQAGSKYSNLSAEEDNLIKASRPPGIPAVTPIQSINSMASTPSTIRTDKSVRPGTTTEGKKSSIRPVLRVQIPSNNASYNTVIHSESSSASSVGGANPNSNSSNLISRNTSAVRYDVSHNQSSAKKQTPTTSSIPGGGGMNTGNLLSDKNDQSRLTSKTLSGNSYGLPPMFSNSPAYPPYLATPLQPTGNNGTNGTHLHGPSYLMLKHLQMAQQQQHHLQQQQQQQQQQQRKPLQQQQQQQHPNNVQPVSQNPARTSTPPLGETSGGPLTGSLPSKFAHDLMVPSPNTSMSMFHDWTLGPTTAKPPPNIPTNNVSSNEIPTSSYNNGNTGLTPYMMVNQTPLSNKFFSFSSDATEDKSAGNTKPGNNLKDP